MLVLTWMISIAGVLQQNHVTLGLIITNWVLIADAIAVLAVGAEIWFYTLQPKTNFLKQWVESSPQAQQVLQDTVRFRFRTKKAPVAHYAMVTSVCCLATLLRIHQ